MRNRQQLKIWIPVLSGLVVLMLLIVVVRREGPVYRSQVESDPVAKTMVNPPAQVEPAGLADKAEAGPLPNFDYREESRNRSGWKETGQMATAWEDLRRRIPGITIDRDPVTGTPKWIASNEAWLTGPGGGAGPDEAVQITREFLDQNRELFGHGSELLDESREVTNYTHDRSASRKVIWHQQYQGIEVFEAVLQANITGTGELMNIGSQFVPRPAGAVGKGGEKVTATLPVEKAVAIAGQSVGERITADSIRPTAPPAETPDRRQQFRAALITDADARLTWLPTGPDSMVLTWDVTLTSPSRAEMYRVLVDAGSGEMLLRQSLTAYNESSFRVYTTENPAPMSPGPEIPSSLQPAAVSRNLETLTSLNPVASPNGWINVGVNMTSGNNADAYTDTDANNSADLPRTTGSPSRVFDFPLNDTQEPTNFKDASVTQLFYWTNFMHDRMYSLGFTEPAGNFQLDNFGRGGFENDPVNAEAQDGSGTNNANFSTPVDGGRGRMQMYNWTSATPDRDGSYDAEVVFHEYGHGVSNRLVGGPSVSISALTTRGMGEGWSDFYGVALTAEEEDNPHGNWAMGGWNRYLQSGWFTEGYYYGLRRYSYSTDMRKNPLTLKDIDPTQIDLHPDVPRNPTYSSSQDPTQVHYMGTVWCTALMEVRTNLILKHGFTIGNERALFLVTEGMKLGPANPSFIQARDGILQAVSANHPGDRGEVWSAFAKRGMGHLATAPSSSTTTGIVETYAVPDSLEIVDRSGWNITGNVGGPFSPATRTLGLRNDGTTALSWTSSSPDGWVTLSPSSGSIAPGATVYVVATAAAEDLKAGFHSTNVIFTNPVTGFNQPLGVRLYVKPPVYESFNLTANPGWTTTGQWAYGVPTGSGGTAGGSGNDPTSGATGPNVYGVNLNGAVSTAIGGPFYLTSSAIDLSPVEETRLRFRRWLNTNSRSNTLTTVEISVDGVNWREVFANPGTTIRDYEWQTIEYDISSVADGQSSVRFRWGYRNLTSSSAYSGWNIDDIEILGQSSGRLALDLAATAAESAGTINGVVHLDPPQSTSVVVNLTSTDTSSATVTPTVTFAPGQVSKPFSVSLIDNTLLDGSRTTQIRASSTKTNTVSRPLVVTDNESATLTLSLPASAPEGATGLVGSISVSAAPTREVVVSLSSSSGSLIVPATIEIPAGSVGPVSFPIQVPDNGIFDGARSVSVAATVAGWATGNSVLTVIDDDSPIITLTGPSGGREGDGSVTFVATVNTIQGLPRVLNVTSSDTSELTVPSTVTIPVGQFSASFIGTIVDDTTADGSQTAIVTVTRPGFPDATSGFAVADNEVAQYTFSPISPSQIRNRAFTVMVTARDVGGAVITNHNGSLNLTSNSPGGPLPFTPTVLSGFSGGVASLPVTFTLSGTDVTLTASDAGGRSATSNAFEITAGPVLAIDPGSLSLAMAEDSIPQTRTLNLANPGSAQIDWDVITVLPTGEVGEATLPEALANLNEKFVEITNLIPNRYLFTDGVTGTNISDGGLDMYDNGNFLGSNLVVAGPNLSYSDNVIVNSANLGQGGKYFTRKHPGLFVFGADVAGLSYFEITGNLGADGSGSTDLAVLTSTRGSRVFKGFVKRVYAAGDPSVNHLIIVEDNGSASHSGSASTDSDQHRVSGLAGVTRIYYLLYASASGGYVNNTATQAIMEAFIDSVSGGSWLTAAPESGSIAPGQQAAVTATINPRGLDPGTYAASLRFRSNDQVSPSQDVPVSLTIRPGIDYFEWSEVPSPQQKDVPFAASLSARDSGGLLVDAFEGDVSLAAVGPLSETISGTGTSTSIYPVDGNNYVNRQQAIYLPAEVGSAGRMDKLALNFATVPGTLNNFTVRLKHTLKTDYSGSGNAVWEGEGWTTVFSGTLNVPATGWMEIPFSEYFNYDGTSNVMVDISFQNTTLVTAGSLRKTTTPSVRSIYRATTASSGAPTTWAGSSPTPSTSTLLTNMTFAIRDLVPCLPQTVTFSEGTWSGDLRIGRSASQIVLDARYPPRPGVDGESNSFSVISSGDVTLQVPAGGVEGEELNASVTLPDTSGSARTVNLISSDPSEAVVPANVVIPAGETSAPFVITLLDDSVLDLGQMTTITASADRYDSASATLIVTDAQSGALTLTLPSSVGEGSSAQGSVSLSAVAGVNIAVTLTPSSDLLTPPGPVIIPAGQISTTFSIAATQNSYVEVIANNEVTVTASTPGASPGTDSIIVADNEIRQITVNLPVSSISEGAAPPVSTSRVALAGQVRAPVTIYLSSNDTTELTVPASVTIDANASQSEVVTVTPVDDTEFDGSRIVTVVASSPGFINGSRNVTVQDDDAHTFTISPISGPVYRGLPFPVTFSARDINGTAIADYIGTPLLSVLDGATGIPVTPNSLTTFVNGTATANVTVGSLAANAILTITDPQSGASNSSNSFAVQVPPAVRINWSNVPSPQAATQPFPVSLSAVDSLGEVVTDFTGTMLLSSITPAQDLTIGTGTSTDSATLNTSREGGRTQSVYLASEMGAAKILTGLSLNVSTLPTPAMEKFTIRLKHTSRASFTSGTNFENDSLFTVYAVASETVAATGWKTFTFQTPFAYDGASNLLVDLTFNNVGTGTAGSTRVSSVTTARRLYAAVNRSAGYGDPLTWTFAGNLASTSLPNIIWQTAIEEPATPSETTPFVAGVWSGNISVLNGGDGMRLLAKSATIGGFSNVFDTSFFSLPPVLSGEPEFSGGLTNLILWSPSNQRGAEVKVERSLSPAFTAPTSSAWTTANQTTFTGLANGSTYHYRAQRRLPGVDPAQVTWSQTSEADFGANTRVGIDLTSSPGSAGIASSTTNPPVTENFESTAPDWSGTIFTRRSIGTYTTEVAPVPAPVTTPLLPISSDGDREGVMSGPGIYALQSLGAANEIADGSITAYVFPRNTLTVNYGGVLLRSSGSGSTLNGYLGRFYYNSGAGSPIWFGVSKITNGNTSTMIPAFASSSFNPATEHAKIQLSAVGSTITARMWRVSVSGGVITETLLGTATGTDTSYTTGVCGLQASNNMVYDDVVIAEAASGSATMTSPLIGPANPSRWGILTYTRTVPVGSTVRVDVLSSSGSLLLTNLPSGANLGSYPTLASHSSIRLRATLTRTTDNLDPQLHDWSVQYYPEKPYHYSDWSNIVSSTQDATVPLLHISSSFRYAQTTASTVSGAAVDTVSGLAAITAGGATATTGNQFATWDIPLVGLAEGSNQITVTASDRAVPPNTASSITTVYVITDPTGDSNGNGISNLLEYAFGIPASLARPEVAMPRTNQSVNPATGERSFTMEYRRRIVRNGIFYTVETSADLAVWGTTTATVQELTVVPTGDGVTEKVIVKVTSPDFNGATKGFIRLNVRLE